MDRRKKYEIDIAGIFNLEISRAVPYFYNILYFFLKPECSNEINFVTHSLEAPENMQMKQIVFISIYFTGVNFLSQFH